MGCLVERFGVTFGKQRVVTLLDSLGEALVDV
jgi:hypothetical protein